MKFPAYLLIVFGLLLNAAAFADEDPALAKAKTIINGTCVSCHGIDGVSIAEQWPSLAGQKAAYLEKQLLTFRDRNGNRDYQVMMNMVGGLDDATIKALAKYYSSLPQP